MISAFHLGRRPPNASGDPVTAHGGDAPDAIKHWGSSYDWGAPGGRNISGDFMGSVRAAQLLFWLRGRAPGSDRGSFNSISLCEQPWVRCGRARSRRVTHTVRSPLRWRGCPRRSSGRGLAGVPVGFAAVVSRNWARRRERGLAALAVRSAPIGRTRPG